MGTAGRTSSPVDHSRRSRPSAGWVSPTVTMMRAKRSNASVWRARHAATPRGSRALGHAAHGPYLDPESAALVMTAPARNLPAEGLEGLGAVPRPRYSMESERG